MTKGLVEGDDQAGGLGAMTQDQITEAQRRLGPGSLSLTFWERWARIHSKDKRRPVHARRELRRRARWWELEAMRGYPSSERSRQYAANLRWLVELMDNGHRVAGVTFEGLVRLHGGTSRNCLRRAPA